MRPILCDFICNPPKILKIYLFLGTLIILGLTFLNPPFAVQDEPHHYFRSVQISHGGLVGTRSDATFSGGVLPVSVLNFGNQYLAWVFNPKIKDGLVAIKQGLSFKWGGPTVPVNFSNTVIYPPFFYLPSATVIFVTRHLHLALMWGFYLGRLCDGFVWLAFCGLALALCSTASRPWIAFCLCIPEIYQLFASFSQDGGNTAAVFLATALLTRLKQDDFHSGVIYLSTILLATFVASKPPYIPFLLVPLIMCYGQNTRAAVISLTVSILLIAGWCAAGIIPTMAATKTDANVSAIAQLHNLIRHPLYIFTVIWNSFKLGHYGQGGDYLARTCIATLSWGWMTKGRWWYDLFFGVGTILAIWYGLKFYRSTLSSDRTRMALIVLMVIGGSLGASFATYLTWSPVGMDWAQGVNGRYFIPSIVLLGAGCAYMPLSQTEAKYSVMATGGLIYLLLPISVVYFAFAVFIRFWWPV
ncbi:MAG: DUF2142 domain-containing protein [Rhodospirillales bacterium]|nr:DUF2142 domain-containing protein [Rhodospirillales bacterium]